MTEQINDVLFVFCSVTLLFLISASDRLTGFVGTSPEEPTAQDVVMICGLIRPDEVQQQTARPYTRVHVCLPSHTNTDLMVAKIHGGRRVAASGGAMLLHQHQVQLVETLRRSNVWTLISTAGMENKTL